MSKTGIVLAVMLPVAIASAWLMWHAWQLSSTLAYIRWRKIRRAQRRQP